MIQNDERKKTIFKDEGFVEIPAIGFATIGVQLSGTFSATLQFEGTINGDDWVSISLTDSTNTQVSSTTTAGVFIGSVAGYKKFRVRASAFVSGTVEVTLLLVSSGGGIATSSGGGGVSEADDADFTAGTTEGTPAMGVYEATPTPVTDEGLAIVGLDVDRNQKVREQYSPQYEDNTAKVARTEVRGTYSYQATAGDNKVILAAPGFLYGIIIGKDVASSIIEVSDHASDGDGNVKIHLESSTLMTATKGYLPVNASFNTGICADLDNQTNVTFIYRTATG